MYTVGGQRTGAYSTVLYCREKIIWGKAGFFPQLFSNRGWDQLGTGAECNSKKFCFLYYSVYLA